MKKFIARIALITLMAAPACSLLSAIWQVHAGNDLAIVLAFPSNGEDQDDSNDNEDTARDGEIVTSQYLTAVSLNTDLQGTGEGNLSFRNHHLEIVTPPPEA